MKEKKIPLKIYVMIVLAIVMTVLSVILISKLVLNHSYVVAYANEEYLVEKEEKLLKLNIPESYLPYYNLGNAAYSQLDYNSAIGYYTKALSLFPVGQKECDIRVNLALSMCYSIDFDHLSSQESIDTALIILYKAKDILLENGWASEVHEEGKDADAQQLKEDIDKMIELLEDPPDGNDQNEDQDQEDEKDQDDNENDSSNSSQSQKEKKQQQQLEKKKKDAMEERKQEQSDLERWGSFGDEDGEDGDFSDGGGYSPW